MMEGKSILEALADERLVVRYGRIEKRSPYKKLKNQMEHCIKELLSQHNPFAIETDQKIGY